MEHTLKTLVWQRLGSIALKPSFKQKHHEEKWPEFHILVQNPLVFLHISQSELILSIVFFDCMANIVIFAKDQ